MARISATRFSVPSDQRGGHAVAPQRHKRLRGVMKPPVEAAIDLAGAVRFA